MNTTVRISIKKLHWVLNRVRFNESLIVAKQYPNSTRAKLAVQAMRSIIQMDQQEQVDPITKKWVVSQARFVQKYGWDHWITEINNPWNSVSRRH